MVGVGLSAHPGLADGPGCGADLDSSCFDAHDYSQYQLVAAGATVARDQLLTMSTLGRAKALGVDDIGLTLSKAALTNYKGGADLLSFDQFEVSTSRGCTYRLSSDGLKSQTCVATIEKPMIFLNHHDGSGQVVGNLSGEPVAVVAGNSSLHFIEFTATGNIRVLTIFQQWDHEAKGFRCVYSRHTSWYPIDNVTYYARWGVARPLTKYGPQVDASYP